MSQKLNAAIAVIGIDIGKNSFHLVGHDHRGAIVLRQKWSRGQVETRLPARSVNASVPKWRVSACFNRKARPRGGAGLMVRRRDAVRFPLDRRACR
ncbi:hypothetical protein V1288_004629 [Bradyrhizobium sp. AZCC 2176]